MKLLLIGLMTIVTFSAQAQYKELKNNDPAYRLDASTHYIKVTNDIKAIQATKKIFLQNNKILSYKEVNQKQPNCTLEKVRSSDTAIVKTIKTGTTYKIEDNDENFKSWEKYLSYRIWQKGMLFWDNGYYQFINCTALDTDDVLSYGTLKKHIGKFMVIYK